MMALNVVQRVEHDHARSDRHLVVHRLAAVSVAAEDSQMSRQPWISFRSLGSRKLPSAAPNALLSPAHTIACKSAGISRCRDSPPRHLCRHRWTMMLFLLPPGVVVVRIIDAAVRAAALSARQRAARYRFGNSQHGFQIARQMPAGIEHARALDTSISRPEAFSFSSSPSAFSKSCFGAENADQALHHLLQIAMHRVGAFALAAFETARAFRVRLLAICACRRSARAKLAWHAPPQPVPRAGQRPADRKANCRPGDSRRAVPPPLRPPRRVPAPWIAPVSASTRMPPIM